MDKEKVDKYLLDIRTYLENEGKLKVVDIHYIPVDYSFIFSNEVYVRFSNGFLIGFLLENYIKKGNSFLDRFIRKIKRRYK